jgi:hypothetical protein
MNKIKFVLEHVFDEGLDWIKDVTPAELLAISCIPLDGVSASAHTIQDPLTGADYWLFWFFDSSSNLRFLTFPVPSEIFSTCGLMNGLEGLYGKTEWGYQAEALLFLKMLLSKDI